MKWTATFSILFAVFTLRAENVERIVIEDGLLSVRIKTTDGSFINTHLDGIGKVVSAEHEMHIKELMAFPLSSKILKNGSVVLYIQADQRLSGLAGLNARLGSSVGGSTVCLNNYLIQRGFAKPTERSNDYPHFEGNYHDNLTKFIGNIDRNLWLLEQLDINKKLEQNRANEITQALSELQECGLHAAIATPLFRKWLASNNKDLIRSAISGLRNVAFNNPEVVAEIFPHVADSPIFVLSELRAFGARMKPFEANLVGMLLSAKVEDGTCFTILQILSSIRDLEPSTKRVLIKMINSHEIPAVNRGHVRFLLEEIESSGIETN